MTALQAPGRSTLSLQKPAQGQVTTMSEPLEYMLFEDLQPVPVLLSPQCFLMIVSAF